MYNNNDFSLLERQYIPTLKSDVERLIHKPTGMEILYVKADDKNKVFFATFKTPPSNNSGVSHILEHSVLCGSKKYKAKDLFNELVKGSVNTYLNAMTFSDKTMYPVASQNSDDFFNLADVYLDSIFNPLIYDTPQFFEQEGWNYSIYKKSQPISINGIVYNEMKGAYGSPERILIKKIDESLFKGTPYEYDSGGVPYAIPSLSYEELLAFHGKYYNPSNCFIYLYGDLDIKRALKLISNAIAAYDNSTVKKSKINLRAEISAKAEPKIDTEYYSVNKMKNDSAYYAVSYAACDYLNFEECLALEILNYILSGHDAAPLRLKLIQSGICGDFASYYRKSSFQTSFTFMGRNAKDGMFPEFRRLIDNTLKEIMASGIDKQLIDGALNRYEFTLYEEDCGSHPKGLVCGTAAASTWVYGGDIFTAMDTKTIFGKIKAEAYNGLFERLLNKYLINNNHGAYTVLLPKEGLIEQAEESLRTRLAEFKSSLSDDELKSLIKSTRALDSFRKKPASKRAINKIPVLEIEQISKNIQPINYEHEGNNILHVHDKEEIVYVDIHFDISALPIGLIPYCGLLRNMLGLTATPSYSGERLIKELDLCMGSISFVADTVQKADSSFIPRLTAELRFLEKNTDRAFDLLCELLRPQFEAGKVKQIADETIIKIESGFQTNGHSVAINRSLSYIFPASNYSDLLSGIGFYKEIYGKQPEYIIDKLNKVCEYILCGDNFSVSVGANKNPDYFLNKFRRLAEFLCKSKKAVTIERIGIQSSSNEGFMLDGGICYNARAFNLYNALENYTGTLNVAKSVLNLEYLWNEIRNKGGAYGCGCSFNRNGCAYFYSYRDAEIIKTFDIFNESFSFLESFTTDKRHFSKFIISAIKPYERPKQPVETLRLATTNKYLGITDEMRQQNREQILSTTISDINAIGEAFSALLKNDYRCTLGSSASIKKTDVFNFVSNLKETI